MVEEEKEIDRLRNIQYLQLLADTYKTTSPTLSRLLSITTVDTERTKQGFSSKPNSKSCPFCGSVYTADNVSIRLKPRMTISKKLRQLINRYAKNPTSLGKYQSNLVNRYINSSNVLMKTCGDCKKLNKIPCQTRHERSLQTSAVSTKSDTTETKVKTAKQKKKEKKKQRRKQRLLEQSSDSTLLSDARLSKGVRQLDRISASKHSDSSAILQKTNDVLEHSSFSTPETLRASSSSVDPLLRDLPAHQNNNLSLSKRSLNSDSSDFLNKTKSSNQNVKVSSLLKNTVKCPQESKSEKRKKSRNMHQQLSKMLAKDKKNSSQKTSLSDFLSSL